MDAEPFVKTRSINIAEQNPFYANKDNLISPFCRQQHTSSCFIAYLTDSQTGWKGLLCHQAEHSSTQAVATDILAPVIFWSC